MKYEAPSASAIKEIADEIGFTVDDAEVADIQAFWAPFVDAFNQVEETPDDLPPVKYARGAWSRPDRAENPHGGWYVKARIEGAADGPLKGRTVAIKDSACVAGIPMMNGASVLEGYIPDMDASVVTRLLDAGATILGKSVCEYFCVSGGSNTSASDIAESPRNPGHTPGGSSTGSAALVASGEVDMALGGDQAGSIRIPASMTGIVGIKPTFGLIPYTGIMGIETTVDHTGPMTGTVADNALFLESMAGEDGLDPRQRVPSVDSYTDALGGNVRGLRIAVVSEGFGRYDLAARCRCDGARGRPAARILRRAGHRNLDPDAHDRACDLGRDLRRRDVPHDVSRLRVRQERRRRLPDLADRRDEPGGGPRRGIPAYLPLRAAARPLHRQGLWRAFPRQGAEPAPRAHRGL